MHIAGNIIHYMHRIETDSNAMRRGKLAHTAHHFHKEKYDTYMNLIAYTTRVCVVVFSGSPSVATLFRVWFTSFDWLCSGCWLLAASRWHAFGWSVHHVVKNTVWVLTITVLLRYKKVSTCFPVIWLTRLQAFRLALVSPFSLFLSLDVFAFQMKIIMIIKRKKTNGKKNSKHISFKL